MAKRLNKEIFIENAVGIASAALVVGIIATSLFWAGKQKSLSSASSARTQPVAQEVIEAPRLQATSVSDAEIEKLYEQKRAEIAAEKAAKAAAARAEQQRIADEEARIAAEKARLAEEKRQAEQRAREEQQRQEQARQRIAEEKAAAVAAAEKAKAEALAAEKRAIAEQARLAAEKKRQAEAARKKAEAEKKRQAEAARKKAEAEKKRQAEAARKKAEAEKKRQAEAARKKAEAEKKRQAEAARKKAEAEKKRIQAALAASLAADITARENETAKQAAIDRYSNAIKSKVQTRWEMPPKLPGGLQVKLSIQLSSSGQVIGNPRVIQSSGYPVFDASAIEAVKRASPLPLPERQEWARVFTEDALILNFP